MQHVALASAVVSVFSLLLDATAALGDDRYRDEIVRWRQKRETDLKADDGWLTVCGLHWLPAQETRIGSDPANDVVLPAHAPAFFGTLKRLDGAWTFQPAEGVSITKNGTSFPGGVIRSDADEQPDVLAAGSVKLLLLQRGERFALRIKDNQSPLRAHFAGLRWHPVREDWRIEARFVAYPVASKLVMDTIVGEPDVQVSPGYVTFKRGGKEYRLDAARTRSGALWFVFRDGTSGRTTHAGARQLYADPPREDVVVLDFNKAVNLPCAYIPYATCPLAPPQNRLSLAIEAGELSYEPHEPGRSASESGR